MSRAVRSNEECTSSTDHACPRPPLERLRFWNGRFLAARDFQHQQADLIRRLEYHQRSAHGEGVVCGYEVKPHPREECRRNWIVTTCGMAYDCCGNTLWKTEDCALELPVDPDDCKEPWEGFIAIRYQARLVDPQPSLFADDLCDPVRPEYGRVRDGVEVVLLTPEEVSEECWRRERPITEADCSEIYEDDCCLPLGQTVPCDTGCSCGGNLILARVIVHPGAGQPEIDTRHRKDISPPRNLTSIIGVNWPHGGSLSLKDLCDLKGRLIAKFSRPLRPTDNHAAGINPHTFSVTFLTATGTPEHILPPDPADLDDNELPSPRLSENRRCAIFDIPDHLLTKRTSIAGSVVHVRLRCDFILDCHGRAVSGAHLGGDVNGRGSGNAVQGGMFESWFYVSSD